MSKTMPSHNLIQHAVHQEFSNLVTVVLLAVLVYFGVKVLTAKYDQMCLEEHTYKSNLYHSLYHIGHQNKEILERLEDMEDYSESDSDTESETSSEASELTNIDKEVY